MLSHNDEYIITGCKDKLINIIRLTSSEVIQTFDKHDDAVTALALSLNDTILISGNFKLIKKVIF